MRIVIDINHPAHVHVFKNFIRIMQKKGHEICVTASEKDLTKYLLGKYNLDACLLGSYGNTLAKKIINVPLLDIRMLSSVRRFKPDLFLSMGSVRAAHVARMLGKPCINFDDDEYSYPYYHFFVNAVCGFSGFKITGKKVIKINGFKEIAYLHPRVFRPDPAILTASGIAPGEEFSVVRFVSWEAYHDVGRKGFDARAKIDLVRELESHSRVFISSEKPLPKELQKYLLPVPPEYIHDLLSYATLLVSDSQTMTTEAAVLGTPAVRSNSFVGENDMGNFIELEQKYNLIFNCASLETALQSVRSIFNTPHIKEEWAKKQEKLLADKIDVTGFMVWFVEQYPASFTDMKQHPEIQYSCISAL